MSGREVAAATGARIRVSGPEGPPQRLVIDSREVGPGDLFVGLAGASTDGGRFAADAVAAGAWGVVVSPRWAGEAAAGAPAAEAERPSAPATWVFEVDDPLSALHALARQWRRSVGARVIGITGSTGKTSTKDITRALLPGRVHASPENWNTEIGLPLSITSAGADADFMVLEMAMRGPGQIAELAAIAEPDVGVITNVGPVHTELLGSIEAVAAAKAELLTGLAEGSPAVVPALPDRLEPQLALHRDRLELIRVGPSGEVEAAATTPAGERGGIAASIVLRGALAEREIDRGRPADLRFEFPFSEPHNLTNALSAIAVGVLCDVGLEEMAEAAARVTFSRLRGERIPLADGITLINDSYNANPISMRAALDHLGALEGARRVAVLGLMGELGEEAERLHAEVGDHARERGVEVVVGVGPESSWYRPDRQAADAEEAAAILAGTVAPGDTVLIKGSRSAGLERVAERLEQLIGGVDG